MMKNKKGFTTLIIVLLLAILLVGGVGIFYYLTNQSVTQKRGPLMNYEIYLGTADHTPLLLRYGGFSQEYEQLKSTRNNQVSDQVNNVLETCKDKDLAMVVVTHFSSDYPSDLYTLDFKSKEGEDGCVQKLNNIPNVKVLAYDNPVPTGSIYPQ